MSAAGPKLKPYFVSTACSSPDSIYQRGSCWIYWRKWTWPGSARLNPYSEALSGTAAIGSGLLTGHLPLPPHSYASGEIDSSRPLFLQGSVFIPFFVKSLLPLPNVLSPSSELSNLGLGISKDCKTCPTPPHLHFRISPKRIDPGLVGVCELCPPPCLPPSH